MTFWCRSWSSDTYLWVTEPDADPGGSKTYGSGSGLLTPVHFHHSSKIKIHKEVQNSRNQVFSYYFFSMMEGSGAGSLYLSFSDPDADPRGPNTFGSYGSGSPTLEEIRKCYNSYGTIGVLGRSLKILHWGLREIFYCINFFVLDCDFLLFSNSFAYFAYFVDIQRLIDLTPTAAGTAVEVRYQICHPL